MGLGVSHPSPHSAPEDRATGRRHPDQAADLRAQEGADALLAVRIAAAGPGGESEGR